MSPWGWRPQRTDGIWRFGAPAMRPFIAAAPWVTVLLLLLLFHLVGGTLTTARGALFDLPDTAVAEGETTGLVALVMPIEHETLVFFDDARYLLSDEQSSDTLAAHLAERMAKTARKTLLVLADRRVAGGQLMRVADFAKRAGATKILFAEKKAGVGE